MKPWNERPVELRSLFNPAFCAVLLLRGISSFSEVDEQGMPFSLTFPLLPLCLHRETRNRIAAHPRTRLIRIIEDSPDLLVGYDKRARALAPYVLEALGFAMHLKSLTVSDAGRLLITKGGVRKSTFGTEESQACQRSASRVGKEFATIADRSTVYLALGIRP